MSRRLSWIVWLACGITWAVLGPGFERAGVAWAARGDGAITSLADVDRDFDDMGEFAGTLRFGSTAAPRAYGLQNIALGQGKYKAVLLRGGLPGNGWDGSPRVELQGAREGDVVTLEGNNVEVQIRAHVAEVSHAEAGPVGSLTKVRRRSVFEGLPPPAYSIVLFDGADTRAFQNPRVVGGLLQAGTELLPTYRNFQLHVEFLVPYMPESNSQARGNSGIYLQSRYELQILDTFGLEGKANECGGLYRQRAPDVNMAFPPLSWQTYDITFHSPIFDACGQKVCNARLTVLHNGITIHQNVEILTKTGAGKPEGPELLPIKLQDHGNPVQFRNLWLRELR